MATERSDSKDNMDSGSSQASFHDTRPQKPHGVVRRHSVGARPPLRLDRLGSWFVRMVVPPLLVLGAGSLTACGQKGPLRLPAAAPAHTQPASSPLPPSLPTAPK